MANTVQSTYSDSIPIGYPGMVANGETSNRISRTVESAAGIAFGQPGFQGTGDHGAAVGDTFAATAVGANGASAPAGATITASPTITAGAKPGVYNITCILGGSATASKWEIEDPDGNIVGIATGNTAFSGEGLAFTITDSGTDPVVGEQFIITVSYTANKRLLGIAIADHGVQPLPGGVAADIYPQYASAAFLNRGVIWVTAGATVAPGDSVYWNPATSRFTKTTTHIRLEGWVFDTTAVDGGLVRIARR